MTIPISLTKNESISLPLKHGPFHVYITIPFSLVVRDFDPSTTPVPKWEVPRSWLAARLFGRQYETPTDAETKATLLVSPTFYHKIWPRLSTLLFGKEEPMMETIVGSDAEDWERTGASNHFWAFATGVTDDDIDRVRAIVLKGSLSSTGGILFAVEEMGEKGRAAWKEAWVGGVARRKSRDESDVEFAMGRKNGALYRYMRAGVPRPFDGEKELSDSESM